MKATIKSMISPDIEFEDYWPEDEENFGFFLEITVGPVGADAANIYGMQVCTPNWLASQHAKNAVVFGRHLIIVFEYNLDRIKESLREYIESCVADNWEEIDSKLSRIGLSEFEDYRP